MKKLKLKVSWSSIIVEFLILVVGILVAFQLDNIKERQNNANLIEGYIEDIDVGLRNDSIYYDLSLKYFEKMESFIDSLENLASSGKFNLEISDPSVLLELSDWYRIFVSNTAFEELNNSSRLTLIENKNLRYTLIAYYQYIDYIKLLDEEYNSSLNRLQEALLIEENQPEIIKQKALNCFKQKKFYMKNYLNHRKICHSINRQIRDLIELQLD